MKKNVCLFCIAICLMMSSNAQSYIGLLGAFPPELVVLKQKMDNKNDTVIRQVLFTTGTLYGKKVVLAQTGVGKVNAAIATALMLEHFSPSVIIFSGIAGGIDTTMAAGDIVIGTQAIYHDYGIITDSGMVYSATRNPVTMGQNPFGFSCDSALVNLALKIAKNIVLEDVGRNGSSFHPVIKPGIIVTGDVFVSSEKLTTMLRQKLHAAATEMEGAAVAQTCWQQHVPFLIIRSLSDKANDKAKNDMAHFLEIASRNAALLVAEIVKSL